MSDFFKMSRVKWEEKSLFDMPWLKFTFPAGCEFKTNQGW